ncbi:membrane-spanning 4-domains subfamily A member 6E isoform X2 [Hylobates moloch]|uniref:membrane-spanning 4-domains subfamily A member 6E isoform X2 n=1 Tax=Hylobates moloch TaxID=81572 RepID=UPI00267533BD|nr:membrane-spanning 4-domains subfamily A member 6E isoform X2 [Hylobates moloch]
MTSRPVPNETVILLPSNVINFSQAEKPEPTNQGQDSLKKCLQAEVKVIGFVISGFLSIITEKRLTKLLVHSSLAGSILSAVSALVGFILLSVTLAALNPASLQCKLDRKDIPARLLSYDYHSAYTKDCRRAKASLAGTLSLILVSTVLEFCLAVLTAVLRGKQTV